MVFARQSYALEGLEAQTEETKHCFSGLCQEKIDEFKEFPTSLDVQQWREARMIVGIVGGKVAVGDITTGLVGYWKLNENPAIHLTIIYDETVNNNDGTLTTNDGATNKSVTGHIGQALSLDGVNDYVGLSSAATQNNLMSVFAWVNVINLSTMDGSYGGGVVMSYTASNCNAGDYFLSVKGAGGSAGGVVFTYCTSLGDTSAMHYVNVQNPYLAINNWYLIGGVWNGTSVKIYVNGIDQGGFNQLILLVG